MKIEKLPSGSYRIRLTQDRKTYSIVLPYKPTQREAYQLLAEKINKPSSKKLKKTFRESALEYIEGKRNVLSPRTIREYGLYVNRLPQWFTELPLVDIEQFEVQKCVNEIAKTKAPKTTRCLYGFISSVLGTFRGDLKLCTTLPQKVKKEPYIPSQEDVRRILEYTKDKNPMFYVPLCLASNGLRRSEICALDVSDLDDDDMLHINKALVEDESNNWVLKTTKTTDSTRTIPISPGTAQAIRNQGYVYNGSPQSISNYLKRAQTELGIEHFSIHKLRHFFASELLTKNKEISFKDVQALGGWKTDTTLKEVYAHAMRTKTDEGKKEVSAKLWESIF